MFNDKPYQNAVLAHSERRRKERETMTCEITNPGGEPCTKLIGHAGGHDLASYGPQSQQFTPDTGGEWRYVETDHAAEISIDGGVRLRAHWTGLSDTETLRSLMKQIVSDHRAVPLLVEALNDMVDLWKRSQKLLYDGRPRDIEGDSQVIAARAALAAVAGK